MLIVFGSLDPHIPEDGRAKIIGGLQQAGTRFDLKLYPAEHAFMRDEGPRYDSEATDQAFAEMIAFFRRIFA
jgi:carboxymethylenebutenolidase